MGGSVTKVTIPDTVTSIGDYAFASNPIVTMTLGNSVTSIGYAAFYDNRLTTLAIPDSVTIIGGNSFSYGRIATLSIGNSVSVIEQSAFSGNPLTTVTIPDSVTSIERYAFSDNPLTTLTLPNSPTGTVTIGDGAFYMHQLTTLTIPQSVTSIGTAAFSGSNLELVAMAGAAPTIAPAGDNGSFGPADNVTVCYYPTQAADYGSLWQGYTAAAADTGLSFDSNGHGTNPRAQLWIAGGSGHGVAPADPSAGEFTFQGWYTAATGGTRWDFTTAVTGFTTLYAQWGVAFTATVAPTVIGAAKVGETLTAHVGKWTPAPALSYAWKQVGSNTVLGTEPTYVPTATDVAHPLTVTVTASKDGHQTTLRTSVATAVVVVGTFAATPTPVIYGTKKVGSGLRADAGDWPEEVTLSYAWKRVGSVAVLASTPRYTVVAGDVGKKLTVTVTATRAGYTSVSKLSAATTVVVAGVFSPAPIPTIVGTTSSGEPLTAVTGSWTSGTTFTYVWKRASTATGTKTTISGATNRTYLLGTADKGKWITVTIVASKPGYTSKTQVSAAKKIAS
jgi:hypothetical protein